MKPFALPSGRHGKGEEAVEVTVATKSSGRRWPHSFECFFAAYAGTERWLALGSWRSWLLALGVGGVPSTPWTPALRSLRRSQWCRALPTEAERCARWVSFFRNLRGHFWPERCVPGCQKRHGRGEATGGRRPPRATTELRCLLS